MRPAPLPLLDQKCGDEESAQHEEQADAEISLGGPVEDSVKTDDEADRDRPEPVERGAIPEAVALT